MYGGGQLYCHMIVPFGQDCDYSLISVCIFMEHPHLSHPSWKLVPPTHTKPGCFSLD